MPRHPTVSIVIPTHDRRGFISTAIESVLAQDYPAVECIVVDDGSTDGTPEVLERYAGRITVLRQENQGQAAAVNAGFAAAHGEFLGVLGDDDRLFAGAVSSVASALDALPEAVAAHGDVLVTDAEGRPLRTYGIGALHLVDCLRHHISPSSTGVLYRRGAMEAAGGWDPALRYGPDTEIWWLLGVEGPYVYVPRLLGTYRVHAGSITGMGGHDLPRAAENLLILERFLQRDDLPPDVDDAVRAEAMRTAYYGSGVIAGGELNRPGERYTIVDDRIARAVTLPAAYPAGEAADGPAGDAAHPAGDEAGEPVGAPADASGASAAAEGLPLVSVVTPVYNEARFLAGTVESVMAQDYPNIEHLLLDDGSTDASPAIIRELEQRYPGRIRAFRHENMGQAKTLNKGFELAAGDLLVIVNSEDPLLPGALSVLVRELLEHPDLVAVYPDFAVIDEHGETVSELHPPDFSLVEMVRLAEDFLGPGVVFRKKLAVETGGWNPAYRTAPDLDFWLRGALVGPYGHVPRVLATWRAHPESITVRDRRTDRALEERFKLLDAFLALPGVPEEVLAVRSEALQNLHVVTAVLMTPIPNAPGERFVIHDRYARRATRQASIESELEVYKESLERSMAATEESQRVVHELMDRLEAASAGASPGGAEALAAAREQARLADERARSAEQRLAEIAVSPSWRITAPLRWIRRAVGAARGGRSRP